MARYDDLPIIEQVPGYHMQSPQSAAILRVTTERALAARDAVLDATDQFFIDSATWGLAQWEELLDIRPDPGADEATRRGSIKAKLRGSGTCNAAMISAIAEAVTGYECVVVERFAQYIFSLILVGDTPGFIDIDAQTIIDAVEIVKPAHLQFVIEGITWQDFMSLNYTWQMLDDEEMTWGMLESKIMVQPRGSVVP